MKENTKDRDFGASISNSDDELEKLIKIKII
jgi:hypothetical protein